MFFDDLQVRHDRGRILEENHYYAYGLKIASLSSKAFGGAQNNYQYQGDYSEFDEDLGWNDFMLRSYDAQIGRWLQNDPFNQFASGYIGMGADPANNVDPTGGIVPGVGCPSVAGMSGYGGFASRMGAGINMAGVLSTAATIGGMASNAMRLWNTIGQSQNTNQLGLSLNSKSDNSEFDQENPDKLKGLPCFEQLFEQYPSTISQTQCTKEDGTKVYDNNCAVRMSYTFKKIGYTLKTSRHRDPNCDYIIAAVNFGRWMRDTFGDPETGSATSGAVPGLKVLTEDEFNANYKDKKGIIYFEFKYGDYGTGHVDIWMGNTTWSDGSSSYTTAGTYKDREPTRGDNDYRGRKDVKIWFWPLEACPPKTAIPCGPVKRN